MSPRQVDRESRKREIALTAIGIFAEKGFDATSMSQIAAGVGLGKGTLYEYFSSKDELIVAAIGAWVDQMVVEQDPPDTSQTDPESRLREFAARIVQAATEPRAMQLFISSIQYVLARPEAFEHLEVFTKMSSAARDEVTSILLDGVASGAFRRAVAAEAQILALNFMAVLDGLFFYYALQKSALNMDAQVDSAIRTFVTALKDAPPG